MTPDVITVEIRGPEGVGKSVIAQRLAAVLNEAGVTGVVVHDGHVTKASNIFPVDDLTLCAKVRAPVEIVVAPPSK